MSKVIPFPQKKDPAGHFITQKPFRFRRAEWETRTPAMVGLHQAALFEEHLEDSAGPDRQVSFVPPHVPLKGGLGQTVMALYNHRNDEVLMKQVYLLAGMMELATRLSHGLLRTDLIRRLFENIQNLSISLNLRWNSGKEGFLLPLPESLYPCSRLARNLEPARTFKELLHLLETETKAQFGLAAEHFVYYLPRVWINGLQSVY